MFVELLAKSNFSFLRGASHPEELVEQAHALSMPALGLSDRGGLYGIVRAWSRSRRLGVKLLVGAEFTWCLPEEPACGVGRRLPRKRAMDRRDSLALVLLVNDQVGYANLCRILTQVHAGGAKGVSAIDSHLLEAHSQGLSAIIPASERSAEEPELEALARTLKDAFEERAWLAAYRYLDGLDGCRERSLLALSQRFGLPVIASARPLMHERSRKELADVLCCIREKVTLDAAGTLIDANAEARLRGEAEMERLFADHMDWVHQTGKLATSMTFDLGSLEYHFPCQLEPGESADDKLARLSWEGARRRYPSGVPGKVEAQILKELELIMTLRVAPYFLSTWEIVEIARQRRILCQGRGSAANSAVCFVLGITAVDPARSNLLFERFMSAERHEPPDIDIDFEHERREEVIQEIYRRYGRDHAAMVSEVICYRGRSALREVSKAFGLGAEQLDRLAGTIGHWDRAESSHEHLAEHGLDPSDERLKKAIAVAAQLRGFPRHLSIHVGGFVLSAQELCLVAPVEPARMPGRTVIPWDKDDLDALGFFKIDILALGMLTAIRKGLELLCRQGEPPFSSSQIDPKASLLGLESPSPVRIEEDFDPIELLAKIPAENAAVYEAISRADTVGVFQIESRAQMSMLPRLRPRCFYDLVIEVAIVRPGPIQGGMVHPYLRRRNRHEPLLVPHVDLWPILKRTLGVPLFQEQVMQIAIVGAGYTGGEADQLRRDMAAWRRTGRLLRHRERLLRGFADKGIARTFGEALFEQIKGFGEYGFPESHAASFALLVYASAWLKVHHPAHFLCAILNSQPMGFYSPSSLVSDAQRHGVAVRDVDVLSSDWDSTLEGEKNSVRLGLRLVKGVGEAQARRLVAARRERPFQSIVDMERRTTLNRRIVEILAESGALENLISGRRQALWEARAPRLEGLFEGRRLGEVTVQLPKLPELQQLWFDYGRKGLSLHDHPLKHLRSKLRQRGVLLSSSLMGVSSGAEIEVAGLVLCRQQPATANGVVFVTLEDESGVVNLIVRRAIFEEYRREVRNAPMLLAAGRLERQAGTPSASSVIHVLVRHVEWLRLPEGNLPLMSRDFH